MSAISVDHSAHRCVSSLSQPKVIPWGRASSHHCAHPGIPHCSPLCTSGYPTLFTVVGRREESSHRCGQEGRILSPLCTAGLTHTVVHIRVNTHRCGQEGGTILTVVGRREEVYHTQGCRKEEYTTQGCRKEEYTTQGG